MVLVSFNGTDFEYISKISPSTKCHATFRFQHEAKITTSNPLMEFHDEILISGVNFVSPSPEDTYDFALLLPFTKIIRYNDKEPTLSCNNGEIDSGVYETESNSFAPAQLKDGSLICCVPDDLRSESVYKISVALNAVDFSEEFDLTIQTKPTLEAIEPEWVLMSSHIKYLRLQKRFESGQCLHKLGVQKS